MKVARQLVLFGVGGTIGFIVNAGVLQLLVSGLAWDRFSGRLISFLCATTTTWLFNRHYTFSGIRVVALRVCDERWVRLQFHHVYDPGAVVQPGSAVPDPRRRGRLDSRTRREFSGLALLGLPAHALIRAAV